MGVLHVWGRKRPRHAAADGGMTRTLVQRAGDVLSAPNLKYTLDDGAHPKRKELSTGVRRSVQP
jgi:hypothetical protein